MTEADRVLVYLGVFVAAFLVAQTNKRAQRCAEGLAIGLAIVALLGLASRLLPHFLSVSEGLDTGARLRYPLGYWNANAMACGLGAALLLWTNRRSPTAALRWIAVGALPLVMLTLYFTYSRGGVLALAIACGGLIVLSRDRLWLAAVLAAAGLGALPAILASQARRALADNVSGPEVIGQGVTVTLILVAGTALTLLLYAGLRRLERGGSRPVRRVEEITRDRRVLRWSAAIAILAVLVAGVAFGGRAWHSFSKAEVAAASPQERFSGLSGSGRQDYWRVAVDAFKEDPIGGKGAGTYQFAWNRLRAIPTSNQVAHSLFLEELADLGIVGAALTVALVLFLLSVGFEAWRRARGPTRDLYAVLLAVSAAFVAGAAIDWFWQIAAVGAIFFIATGILVAGRCAQIAAADGELAVRGERRRFGLAVTGLVVAWLTAIALTGPLLVESEIKSSQSAAANGDLADAQSHAETARSIEPWAASPYLQLGLLAEAKAEYPTGAQRLGQAIDREEENWVLYYLRARIEHEGGESAAAAADLAEARRLNPLEACLGEGFKGCG